jgi:hypothetical protein
MENSMGMIKRFEDIVAWQEARKLQSFLYVALDVRYIDATAFRQQYEEAHKTKALTGGFKRGLREAPDT